MTELAAFLRARLEEDEKAARQEHDEPRWNEYDEGDYNSPRRILSDIGAKRDIIDLYEVASQHDDSSLGVTTLRAVLRCLARPYAAHPDYSGHWL